MTSSTADGRAFYVVCIERERDLRLRIRDRTWQIRSGETPPAHAEIDGVHSWTARGRLEPRLLEIRIANRNIATWERAWRRGLRMEIAFSGAAELIWRLGLEATNRATDVFVQYIDRAQGAPAPRAAPGPNINPIPGTNPDAGKRL